MSDDDNYENGAKGLIIAVIIIGIITFRFWYISLPLIVVISLSVLLHKQNSRTKTRSNMIKIRRIQTIKNWIINPDIRVTNEDRELAISVLDKSFESEALTLDEYLERMEQVPLSKFHKNLYDLVFDLPIT